MSFINLLNYKHELRTSEEYAIGSGINTLLPIGRTTFRQEYLGYHDKLCNSCIKYRLKTLKCQEVRQDLENIITYLPAGTTVSQRESLGSNLENGIKYLSNIFPSLFPLAHPYLNTSSSFGYYLWGA